MCRAMLAVVMLCPHCNTGIHEAFQVHNPPFTLGTEQWVASYQRCPECEKAIVKLASRHLAPQGQIGGIIVPQFLAYPRNASPRPVAPEVPSPHRDDYTEAVAVLPLSPKASAAISRRLLQAILKEKASTTSKDLFDQIEEVISTGKLPSHLSDGLHAVRNIGNFAAHEMKSKVTGAIVDVEPGEAEWNLDVIESLFDFYFVEPAKTAARKTELNKRLREVGKPELP